MADEIADLQRRIEAARSALVGDPTGPGIAQVVRTETGAGPKDPGVLGVLNNAVEQGATLGFADEVGAAGGATGRYLAGAMGHKPGISWGDAYDQALTEKRATAKAGEEAHPVTNIAGQVLGGITGAGPARAAVAGATPRFFGPAGTSADRVVAEVATAAPATAATLGEKAAGYGRNVAQASGAGAVAGFGSGEGDAGSRAAGAATGAALGAGLATAVPAVATIVGRAGGKALDILGMRNADKASVAKMLQAAERDGVSPEQALAKFQEWQAAGSKPEMLIDLFGENFRGLARSAAGTPGAAKNTAVRALEERQAGQGERVKADVQANLSPNTNYYGTVDDLIAQRSTNAGPLYEQAFSNPAPVHNPRIQQFIDDPIMKAGLAKGMELQRLEALAQGKPFNWQDYKVKLPGGADREGASRGIGGGFEEGAVSFEGVPNLRTLDAAKRGLDAILEGYRDSTTGRLVLDQRGRAIDQVRKAFVGELDNATAVEAGNPASSLYSQARAAYAGPSQSRDALELGRSIFNKDSEVSAKAIGALSEGDREFFRAGVAKAIKSKVDDTPDGADVVKRMFRTPAMREKLETAFGSPEAFQRFASNIEREANMFENARMVSPKVGSQTNQRGAEQADMGLDAIPGLLATFAERGPRAAAGRAAGMAVRRFQGMNSSTSDALAPRMFNADPTAVTAELEGLAKLSEQNRLSANLREKLARALTTVGGTDAGVLTR